MVQRYECDVTQDFVQAEMLGFGVGGKKDDGSLLMVVALTGSPILAAVTYTDREAVDKAIEALKCARDETWGPG